MSLPITLQWRAAGGGWQTLEVARIPVLRNVKIRIDFNAVISLPDPSSLVRHIESILREVGGRTITGGNRSAALIEPDENDNLLEVLVSDGQTAVPLEPRITEALSNEHSPHEAGGHAWVLPCIPRPPAGQPSNVAGIFPESVQPQNIAFWSTSIDELALTILARSGVASLDRRVFISYRRLDTEPMANQIREALQARNFDVFLDTVSVEPGVNFQDRLFEQLADKSMVVLLHSETFTDSKWAMAEVDYTRDHDLSLLILRLPSVPGRKKNQPGDPPDKRRLEDYYRGGDVLYLEWECDIAGDQPAAHPKPPYSLNPDALDRVIVQITEQHDKEMIRRLASLRTKILDSLSRNGLAPQEASEGVSIMASSDDGKRTYRLFPGARPPGLVELYQASTCDQEPDHRIVVGNISSYNPERILQLNWTVNNRNVSYADVFLLDMLANRIRSGNVP